MRKKHERASIVAVWAFTLCIGSASTASAQNTARDLPNAYVPGVTFSVSIAITPPDGTFVVGLEDQPPPGWIVLNISHNGTYDSQNKKVKWGPFFSGSVPPAVGYDVRSLGGGPGEKCFTGTASFDALNQPIAGDQCIAHSVPTLSGGALSGLAIALLALGTLILRRRSRGLNR